MPGRDAFAPTAQLKDSSHDAPEACSCEETRENLRLGGKVGQYELIRIVGEGGMGEVYEASHVRLGKRVAIKLLHGHFAKNDEMTRRFLREGVVACQIGHPNIVDITDVGVHEGVPYLVMEFLEGESLEERIYGGGRMGIADVADLLVPVVDALAAAHERGIIHRDVKPANIILARTRHGRVEPKVVDFGISRLEGGADLTRVTLVPGTPCYMAPELGSTADSRGDPKSDQFALGVTLYETIAGERPRNVGRERAIPLRALRPDVPVPLEQAVMRAMHVDADRRFPTVRQLGEALLPLAGQTVRATWSSAFGRLAGSSSPSSSTPSSSSRSSSRAVRAARSRSSRPPSRRSSHRASRRQPSLFYTLMLLLLSAGVGILTVVAWDIWTSPEITEVTDRGVQTTAVRAAPAETAAPELPSASEPMTEELPPEEPQEEPTESREEPGERHTVTRLETRRTGGSGRRW